MPVVPGTACCSLPTESPQEETTFAFGANDWIEARFGNSKQVYIGGQTVTHGVFSQADEDEARNIVAIIESDFDLNLARPTNATFQDFLANIQPHLANNTYTAILNALLPNGQVQVRWTLNELRTLLQNLGHLPRLRVAEVWGERVRLGPLDTAATVHQLLNQWNDHFGVRLSSSAAVKAIRDAYKSPEAHVRKGIRASYWTMGELKAIGKALQHFRNVLGNQRAQSNSGWRNQAQEILTIGKIDRGIGSGTWQFTDNLLGHYISPGAAILYGALAQYGHPFDGQLGRHIMDQNGQVAVAAIASGLWQQRTPNEMRILLDAAYGHRFQHFASNILQMAGYTNAQFMADLESYFRAPATLNANVFQAFEQLNNGIMLEGGVVHEITHGVFKRVLGQYIANATDGFWRDRKTKSQRAGAESPVNSYGETNADEDLSEAVRYYFTAPRLLQQLAPHRYQFIHDQVQSW